MTQFLFIFGSVSLVIFIIGIGPASGAYISHKRHADTAEFVHTLQMREDDTQQIDMPEIGENIFADYYFEQDPLFSKSLPDISREATPLADEVMEWLAQDGMVAA